MIGSKRIHHHQDNIAVLASDLRPFIGATLVRCKEQDEADSDEIKTPKGTA
jgi:hypothetical protein